MKELKSYILEVLNTKDYKGPKRFTAGGTISNRILLFDIDETLLKSDAKIYVYKDNEIVRTLTPEEFNFDHLNSGESYDFNEFSDIKVLMRSVMLPYWNTLQREYRRGTHIGILTARSNIKMIDQFFNSKGIDIKDDLIFAVGDETLDLTSKDIEDRKAECVERLFEVGYNTFIFFDDNQNNLNSVKKLENKLPIKIHTIKA